MIRSFIVLPDNTGPNSRSYVTDEAVDKAWRGLTEENPGAALVSIGQQGAAIRLWYDDGGWQEMAELDARLATDDDIPEALRGICPRCSRFVSTIPQLLLEHVRGCRPARSDR